MHVTVGIAGEDADATYADLFASVDLSPHAVSALVDSEHVPTDQSVEHGHARVIRLSKGG